jgi:four helix bundle protein
MLPYERFDSWKLTHKLALAIYAATEQWPVSERYGITAQIRRAALSAPTNIAEGSAKKGSREFRRYLDIALGSLSEVSYLLRFSKDRGILKQDDYEILDHLRDQAGKATWGLSASMSSARSR